MLSNYNTYSIEELPFYLSLLRIVDLEDALQILSDVFDALLDRRLSHLRLSVGHGAISRVVVAVVADPHFLEHGIDLC